jgi:16S rRNA (cytosine1402-N4)-methyltransferase
MEFSHQPVMLSEAITALNVREGGFYVDGTIGGGGHTREILDRVGSKGTVLGLDRDPEAIRYLKEALRPTAPNLILRQGNFSRLDEYLIELGGETVDGILLDLGVSSFQLEQSSRGFTFLNDEPLDMRMDPDAGSPASDLVNRLPEKELADLIYRYGEERASRRIARGIVWARKEKPITSTAELARQVRRSLYRPGHRSRIDPATRTFMALRLAVNNELGHLEKFLALAPQVIKPHGRMVIISFHSLEDRLVKRALVQPMRAKDQTGILVALFKKPLRPESEEVARNPRARSARLRAGERR